ncbi:MULTISPECIES: hypothetical protein [unclassified Mesorhizobium]|uniref:hypothetical protein n=1 Tax=unclassified Mesorhizobium TaxID=325217 RepID=UPI0015E42145|nr:MULTISPECIES: hypothetical protein [unclassified Mesorhizobium]
MNIRARDVRNCFGGALKVHCKLMRVIGLSLLKQLDRLNEAGVVVGLFVDGCGIHLSANTI